MVTTANVDELLGAEGVDPAADEVIRGVLGKLGLDESDLGDEIAPEEGDDFDGPTMTAAAKITAKPLPATKLTAEQITTLAQQQVSALTETMYATTDERKLRETQGQINEFTLLERIAPYMPAAVNRPVRFGHSESESFRFNTPTVRGVHMGGEHSFWNHIYETSDPVEIGALRRLVAEGLESSDDLLILEPRAEAYKDRYGRLLGWEKPGSANVRRWAKLGMLRTGVA